MFIFRETLPEPNRTTGGLVQTGHDFARLLSDRVLLGTVLVTGLISVALFAYIAGATYVLQDIYGLSPQGTLVVGLVMCLTGAAGLLATALLHLPVIAVIFSLFTMVGGVAATSPPTTSLAMTNYPDIAGTASSLLGLARFGIGGLAAPLVGLGGSHDALPLGLVTVASTLLAGLVYLTTIRGRTNTPPHVVASTQPHPTTTSTP